MAGFFDTSLLPAARAGAEAGGQRFTNFLKRARFVNQVEEDRLARQQTLAGLNDPVNSGFQGLPGIQTPGNAALGPRPDTFQVPQVLPAGGNNGAPAAGVRFGQSGQLEAPGVDVPFAPLAPTTRLSLKDGAPIPIPQATPSLGNQFESIVANATDAQLQEFAASTTLAPRAREIAQAEIARRAGGEQPTGPDAFGVNRVRPSTASAASTPVKALLDTISDNRFEGGSSYNIIVGGSSFDSFAKHPGKVGFRYPKDHPDKSLAGKGSTAAGRYQITKTTWDTVAKRLGLKDFSPANQDRAAIYLASERYKRETGRDLETDLNSQDPRVIASIGQALSGEWTSLPGGIQERGSTQDFVSTFGDKLSGAEATTHLIGSSEDTGQPFAPGVQIPSPTAESAPVDSRVPTTFGSRFSPATDVQNVPDWAREALNRQARSGGGQRQIQQLNQRRDLLRQATETRMRQLSNRRAQQENLLRRYRSIGNATLMQQTMEEINSLENQINAARLGYSDADAPLAAQAQQLQADNALLQLTQGDPRMVQQLWTSMSGRNVSIQPRSDGKFNLFFVGPTGETQTAVASAAQIGNAFKEDSFKAHRDMLAKVSASTASEDRELTQKITLEAAKAGFDFKTKTAVAKINNHLKGNGYGTLKESPSGDGSMIAISKSGDKMLVFTPGATQNIGGREVAVNPIRILPITRQGVQARQ